MSNIGNVTVGVSANAQGIPEQIQRQTQAPLERVGRSMSERIYSGMQSVAAAGAVGVATAFGVALNKGFGRVKALDTAKAMMSGLGYVGGEIKDIMKTVSASVDNTTASLGDGANAAALMLTSGVKPGKELENVLRSIVGTAEATGSGVSDITAIYQKMAASGKVSGEELAQFASRGVNAIDMLAKHFGITQQEVKARMGKGGIGFTFQEFSDAMQSGMSGMGEAMAGSFGGLVANVTSAAGRIGAAFMGPLLESSKTVLAAVLPAMKSLAAALIPVGENLAKYLQPAAEWLADKISEIDFAALFSTGEGLGAMAQPIALLGAAMVSLASGGLAQIASKIPFIDKFAGTLGKLGGPIGLAVLAFGALVATSPQLQTALGNLFKALIGFIGPLVTNIAQLAQLLLPAFLMALQGLTGVLTIVIDLLAGFFGWLSQPEVMSVVISLLVGLTAGFIAYKAAVFTTTLVTGGYTLALHAQTAATKIATTAKKLFDLAMKAGPIGLVITAITALVAGLMYFFTQTELGKQVWKNVTDFMASAATWMWESVLKPVIEALGAAWDWLWKNVIMPVSQFIVDAWVKLQDAANWMWKQVLKPTIEAIGAIFGWLWKKVIKPTIDFIIGYFRTLAEAADWLYKNGIKPAMDLIQKIFIWIWEQVIKRYIDFVIGYFRILAAAATWLYEEGIKPAIDFIAGIFKWIWEKVIKVQIDNIVKGFQFWAGKAKDLYEKEIKPKLELIGKIFTWLWEKGIKPIIDFIVKKIASFGTATKDLYEKTIRTVLSKINDIFIWLRDKVITPVVNSIKGALEGLGTVFTRLRDSIVKPVFDGISSLMKGTWDWINNNVFTPFKNGIDLLGKSFETAKSAIGRSWNGIKSAAGVPINFVLDTVWNNGLRSFWNDVVGTLGLNDMKLPRARTVALAKGGVLPGYTPGRDVHDFYSPKLGRLRLSGGEAIMRPEFTRMMGGKKGIDWLNSMARRGKMAFANGGVFGAGAAASGGALESGGFFDDIFRNIANGVKIAWDFVTDPMGMIQKHVIDGIIRPLGQGGNVFQKGVLQLPINLVKALGPRMKNAEGAEGSSSFGFPEGDHGNPAFIPSGFMKMWRVIERQFPWANLHSSYRPGAKERYHAAARAVDITPSMQIFDWIRSKYPKSRQLIYTPAGNRQLNNGMSDNWSRYPGVNAMHNNHIHWAMAQGGVIPKLYDRGGWLPHGGMAVNKTGKPEAVLTPDQSAALMRGLDALSTFSAPLRGFRPSADFREGRASTEQAYSGPKAVFEAGAFQLSGSDPRKVAYDVADIISRRAEL